MSLNDLATELHGNSNGDVTTPRVDGHPAIRHQYTEDLMTRIDYHTHVPGRSGLITFAFSAPAGPLAEAMNQLFDAMASTLRWQP